MKFFNALLSLLICFSLSSCVNKQNPYQNALNKYIGQLSAIDKESGQVNKHTTSNFNLRKPSMIIIHYTGLEDLEDVFKVFESNETSASAHYLIDKKGNVIQLVNDYLRSWHAGESRWGNILDVNSISIGIELQNNGTEAFPKEQISSLINLLKTLKIKYNISPQNILGHSDIAPGRKIDPGVKFPWKELADNNLGIWYSDSISPYPQSFNCKDAFRIIGYDISNYNATVYSFKSHFNPSDTSNHLSELDKKILYSIYSNWK